MRNLSMAVLAASALIAVPAMAQTRGPAPSSNGAGIPAPRGMMAPPPAPVAAPRPEWRQPAPPRVARAPQPQRWQSGAGQPPRQDVRANRWGGRIEGRWWGGARAPGGWRSYRRPSRGWSLPSYWMNPGFGIQDYYSYGLRAPDAGYSWVRYYDDAVLVDRRGRVIDWADQIAWDDAGDDAGYAGDGWAGEDGYFGQPDPGYDPYPRIEADVDYDAGPAYGYRDHVARPAPMAPPVQVYRYPADGGSYAAGYGSTYYGGGYYAGGGTTTTVVIQPSPIVTTTTVVEEVVEEAASTRTYAAPRRAVRRPARKYRPKPRPVARQCSCQCVCR